MLYEVKSWQLCTSVCMHIWLTMQYSGMATTAILFTTVTKRTPRVHESGMAK